MTNKCTIISQIITLLHVSTLSCHPQTACNQYLAKLLKFQMQLLVIQFTVKMFHIAILLDCAVFTQQTNNGCKLLQLVN